MIIPNAQRWGCASYWTPCSDIPRFLSWFAAVATTAVQHGEDTPPPPLSPTWSPYLPPLISSPPFLWNCSTLAAMNPLCHCTYFPVAGIQESFALCCGKGHGFLCFCWETHVDHVPSLLWPFKEIPCWCSASWRPSQCAVSPSETSSTPMDCWLFCCPLLAFVAIEIMSSNHEPRCEPLSPVPILYTYSFP